jgi:hypothetical protein
MSSALVLETIRVRVRCKSNCQAESQIRDDRSTASDKNRRGNHMTRTDTPVVCGNAATHAGARNGHQDSTLENIESSEWKGTNHVQYAWGNTTKRVASDLKPHLTDVTSGHPGTSAETTEDCGKQTVPAGNVGLEKRWRRTLRSSCAKNCGSLAATRHLAGIMSANYSVQNNPTNMQLMMPENQNRMPLAYVTLPFIVKIRPRRWPT